MAKFSRIEQLLKKDNEDELEPQPSPIAGTNYKAEVIKKDPDEDEEYL